LSGGDLRVLRGRLDSSDEPAASESKQQAHDRDTVSLSAGPFFVRYGCNFRQGLAPFAQKSYGAGVEPDLPPAGWPWASAIICSTVDLRSRFGLQVNRGTNDR